MLENFFFLDVIIISSPKNFLSKRYFKFLLLYMKPKNNKEIYFDMYQT